MSPILVRPVREQLEHDRVIRLLLVRLKRRHDVVEQLDRALAEVDLTHAEDGLVIFAAPGEHQVWSLTRPVPERVVLSDTFLTRNLVAAQAAERPFWALAVSPDRVSLWNGGGDRVTEARVGGFPMTRDRDNFEIFEAGDGFGVRLVAANGEIIARGESYATKSSATRAVKHLAVALAGQIAISSS